VESDLVWPTPRAETTVRYVDDREFTRLVLSRRKLQRVGTLGRTRQRIRDVSTGETFELARAPGPEQAVTARGRD
jgi:hypothetical protein